MSGAAKGEERDGNLVTNATWQDFWLNEGWTTYAEQRITEVLEGKDVAALRSAFAEKQLIALMERFGELDYVDLRFGERVFLRGSDRRRDTPVANRMK